MTRVEAPHPDNRSIASYAALNFDGMAGVTLPTVSDPSVLTAGTAVFDTETPGAAVGVPLLPTDAPTNNAGSDVE